MRIPRLLALLACSAALLAAPMAVADDSPMRVVAVPGAEGFAAHIQATAVEDRASVVQELGRDYDGTTEVRLALDVAGFQSMLPAGARVPDWAKGVAFPELNLVVIRGRPGDPDVRATLRHELSHIAVGRLATHPVPRWFLEGLATIHAGDAWDRKGPSLVRAALADGLFSFESLATHFPAGASDAELAYAQSADFVQFLSQRGGEDSLHALLRRAVSGEHFDRAFLDSFGLTPRVAENEWRRSLARWELALRMLLAQELWWGLLAFLLAFAWYRLRQRRIRGLARLEAQEQAEAAAAFAEATAFFADQPPGPDDPPPPPARDEPSFDDDPFSTPGKKPTLH